MADSSRATEAVPVTLRRHVARLGTLILESVNDTDLRAIIRALVKEAKDGNIVAIREVLTRVVGKPPEGPDPDRLDLEELTLKIEEATTLEEGDFQRISEGLPPVVDES